MVRLPPVARPLYPLLKPAYTRATLLASPVGLALSRARGGQLPTGVVATTEQAAASSGGRCVVVREAEAIVRTTVPDGPLRAVFTEARHDVAPRTVVAELPGGRVLGPHHAVVTGRGDLVQDLSYYFGTTRAREHPLFLHPFPGPPTEVPGRLGVLATRGDVNYYHFLMDVIPRLAAAQARPDLAMVDRWYVSAGSRFQSELLDRFGIAADRRVDATTSLHVRADCLVVPSPPSMTVVNPPWVVAWLRDRLLTTPIDRVPGRGLYVTRGASANNRAVVNEDDLIAMLARRDFAIIDPGELSVQDQITAFAQASVIVAPHGAALANLVFAGPGATVVELFPAGAAVPDFWKLAGGVPGLEYRYLNGVGRTDGAASRSRPRLLVSDMTVDLDALGRVLDGLAVTRP